MLRTVAGNEVLESLESPMAGYSFFLVRCQNSGELRQMLQSNFRVQDPSGEVQNRLRTLQKIAHPNLTRWLELGLDQGQIYAVHELHPVESLEAYLGKRRKLAPEKALDLIGDLSQAFSILHRQGFVQGGLTARAILYDHAGERLQISVLPRVGIVPEKAVPTAVPSQFSSWAMAPEEAEEGLPTAQTDVFSLASLLYRVTTGVALTDTLGAQGVSLQTIFPPKPPSHHHEALPPEFDRLLLEALAFQPSSRPELEGFLQGISATLEGLQDAGGGAQAVMASGRERRKDQLDRRKRKKGRREDDTSPGFFTRVSRRIRRTSIFVKLLFLGLVAGLSSQWELFRSFSRVQFRDSFQTRRAQIRDGRFDREKVHNRILEAAERSIQSETTPTDFEPRMRALQGFMKSLRAKDRERVVPKEAMAELRLTYAQNKKDGCVLLDQYLRNCLEFLRKYDQEAKGGK